VLVGVKFRIAPQRLELCRPLVCCDAAVRKIHPRAIVWAAMGFGVDLQIIGAGNIKYLLLSFAPIDPAFYNLHPLQRTAVVVT